MKFRLKITFVMICLMTVFFSVGGTMLISTSFHNSLDQEIVTDIEYYKMILRTMLILNDSTDWSSDEDIADVLKQLIAQSCTQEAVRLSSEDSVIFSQGNLVSSFGDLSKETTATALSYRIFAPNDVQTSALHPNTEYYIQICGAFSVNESIKYLDIAYDVSPIYYTRYQQQQIYLRIFTMLVLASAVCSYILSFFLTRPLTQLSRASRQVAAGNYQYCSKIRSHDEVGELSEDFNRMTDTLVAHMEELKESIERQNQFIGNFTHELKTPLTSIIGYADLLRGQTLNADDAQDAANYIFSEGKRLERLSLKLLDIIVADREDLSLVPTNPHLIVANIVEHLRDDFRRMDIDLSCQCEEGSCLLEPDFFTSLVRNLIENARRAINGGGQIIILLKIMDDGCQLMVYDNGKGIPTESLNHLTEAFYRVDKARSRAHGGAGLGLSLCASIAQLHNGDIQFNSRENSGTIVTVNLRGGLA